MAAPVAKRMKGPTAYMLFSEEQRPEVMGRLRAEAPDGKVAVTVVAKAIGELWKGLSEEQKAAYKEKAQQRAAGMCLLLGVCMRTCCFAPFGSNCRLARD